MILYDIKIFINIYKNFYKKIFMKTMSAPAKVPRLINSRVIDMILRRDG